ncbi:MAG: hypothetical protein R3F49_25190 [Planctomycetota bacterium]
MRLREEYAAEPEEPPVPVRVARKAQLLALAYAIEAAVEDGRYRSVAEVARVLGISRARLSQVMRRRWALVTQQEEWLNT